MASDMFSSTSQTEQRTSDNDVAAADQAVVLQRSTGGDRNSNNANIRVLRGGNYTVNNTTTNTIDTSRLIEGFQSLAQLIATGPKPNPITGISDVDPVDPVTGRLGEQVTDAPAASAAQKTKVGVIVAAIVLILLGAIILRRKK